MSNWLDFSNNANSFLPIYVKGFVDVSGGDIIARTGNVWAGDLAANVNILTSVVPWY